MASASVVAVFDAGPLIYLDALGYLPALVGLYRVVIPNAVSDELERRPGAFGGDVPSMENVELRSPAAEDMRVVLSGPPSIGAGEMEVVSLALGMGALAAIDDRRGVRRASRLGVAVVGTLVVLVELHRAGLARRTFSEDLEALDEAGMYLTNELKRRVMERYREAREDAP